MDLSSVRPNADGVKRFCCKCRAWDFHVIAGTERPWAKCDLCGTAPIEVLCSVCGGAGEVPHPFDESPMVPCWECREDSALGYVSRESVAVPVVDRERLNSLIRWLDVTVSESDGTEQGYARGSYDAYRHCLSQLREIVGG